MGSYEPSPGGNTPTADRRIVIATAVPTAGWAQQQRAVPAGGRLPCDLARHAPAQQQLLDDPGFLAYALFEEMTLRG